MPLISQDEACALAGIPADACESHAAAEARQYEDAALACMVVFSGRPSLYNQCVAYCRLSPNVRECVIDRRMEDVADQKYAAYQAHIFSGLAILVAVVAAAVSIARRKP